MKKRINRISLVSALVLVVVMLVIGCSAPTTAPPAPASKAPAPTSQAPAPIPSAAATTYPPVTWTGSTYVNDARGSGFQTTLDWADEISKRTNGAFKINWNMGGVLPFNASDISKVVGQGVIQIADDSFSAGNIPHAVFHTLPLLMLSASQNDALMKVIGPYQADDYTKLGATYLTFYYFPLQILWTVDRSNTLADMKGKKIRITRNTQNEVLKALGATGVTIQPADVESSLQKKVVDGVVTAASGGGMTWYPFLQTGIRLPVSSATDMYVVNTAAFNKLPKEWQDLIKETAPVYAKKRIKMMADQEDAIQASMMKGVVAGNPIVKSQGLNFVDVPMDTLVSMQKQLPAYWEEQAVKACGPEGKTILAEVLKAIGLQP